MMKRLFMGVMVGLMLYGCDSDTDDDDVPDSYCHPCVGEVPPQCVKECGGK